VTISSGVVWFPFNVSNSVIINKIQKITSGKSSNFIANDDIRNSMLVKYTSDLKYRRALETYDLHKDQHRFYES